MGIFSNFLIFFYRSPFSCHDAIINHDLRPLIPSETPLVFADLTRRCWAANPLQRPPFDKIVKRLKDIMHSLSNGAKSRFLFFVSLSLSLTLYCLDGAKNLPEPAVATGNRLKRTRKFVHKANIMGNSLYDSRCVEESQPSLVMTHTEPKRSSKLGKNGETKESIGPAEMKKRDFKKESDGGHLSPFSGSEIKGRLFPTTTEPDSAKSLSRRKKASRSWIGKSYDKFAADENVESPTSEKNVKTNRGEGISKPGKGKVEDWLGIKMDIKRSKSPSKRKSDDPEDDEKGRKKERVKSMLEKEMGLQDHPKGDDERNQSNERQKSDDIASDLQSSFSSFSVSNLSSSIASTSTVSSFSPFSFSSSPLPLSISLDGRLVISSLRVIHSHSTTSYDASIPSPTPSKNSKRSSMSSIQKLISGSGKGSESPRLPRFETFGYDATESPTKKTTSEYGSKINRLSHRDIGALSRDEMKYYDEMKEGDTKRISDAEGAKGLKAEEANILVGTESGFIVSLNLSRDSSFSSLGLSLSLSPFSSSSLFLSSPFSLFPLIFV
jgi:hypothetical protein